ncbi:MAG TPA: hypothetical protein VMM56_11135 [Planctomycetaceae bacterium]|nr:hypothetical protein [Planctomycetaceae bacterium]
MAKSQCRKKPEIRNLHRFTSFARLGDSAPLRRIRATRATPNDETKQIPKYFPNYLKTVQNPRVSLELDNLTSFKNVKFDKHREFLMSISLNCETGRRWKMLVFPGRKGCLRQERATRVALYDGRPRLSRKVLAHPGRTQNPLLISPLPKGEKPRLAHANRVQDPNLQL